MPNKNVTINQDYTAFGQTMTLTMLRHLEVMYQSGRGPNGRLRLEANPFTRIKGQVVSFNASGPNWTALPASASSPDTMLWNHGLSDADNRAAIESYNRFRGKIYKGSASLGVTAGSYGQSADMIRNRYNQLLLRDEYWEERRRRSVNFNPRRAAKEAAGFHLEVIFGWMPLIQDIVAATATVCQLATPPSWVSARSRVEFNFLYSDGGPFSTKAQHTGRCTGHYKRSGAVEIANLNLWLAERAGLLNAVSVAWDLVPWSFLVNMVSNAGQLVNSVTDYVGLSLKNGSTTRSYQYDDSVVAYYNSETYGSAAYRASCKYTTLGAVNVPPLTLKLPNVNWETAAMAASLFTQKFNRLIPPRITLR